MMKKLSFDKTLFYLACGCVFLPWFTWDAQMMGYCWGFDFILELAVPLFVIALYLYSESESKLLVLITEICELLFKKQVESLKFMEKPNMYETCRFVQKLLKTK